MKKYFRITTMAYLILLSAMLGAGLYAGAVVAPVIFHSDQWLGTQILSHFQEGLIMTENFVRLSVLIDITIVAIALYEGYKYKSFERDGVTMLSAIMAILSATLFAHYYLPDILNMQLAGEAMTKSDAFASAHMASEIDFKIFSVALLVLIVKNMQKACK